MLRPYPVVCRRAVWKPTPNSCCAVPLCRPGRTRPARRAGFAHGTVEQRSSRWAGGLPRRMLHARTGSGQAGAPAMQLRARWMEVVLGVGKRGGNCCSAWRSAGGTDPNRWAGTQPTGCMCGHYSRRPLMLFIMRNGIKQLSSTTE